MASLSVFENDFGERFNEPPSPFCVQYLERERKYEYLILSWQRYWGICTWSSTVNPVMCSTGREDLIFYFLLYCHVIHYFHLFPFRLFPIQKRRVPARIIHFKIVISIVRFLYVQSKLRNTQPILLRDLIRSPPILDLCQLLWRAALNREKKIIIPLRETFYGDVSITFLLFRTRTLITVDNFLRLIGDISNDSPQFSPYINVRINCTQFSRHLWEQEGALNKQMFLF